MTSKEAALLLRRCIKQAKEFWVDQQGFVNSGEDVSMSVDTAKELLAVIKDQEAELKQLREIFAKDLCADIPALEYAKIKERERCAAIVLQWANRCVPARKQPLLNAAKQIAKGD